MRHRRCAGCVRLRVLTRTRLERSQSGFESHASKGNATAISRWERSQNSRGQTAAKVSKSVTCWSQTDRMVRMNRQNFCSLVRGKVSLLENPKMSENSLALPLGFKGERYENCDLYLDGYMLVASASRILTTCYSR